MRLLVILVASAGMWAQSLQILPFPPGGRGIASFQIMLISPAGKEPVALQWKLWVPDGVTVAVSDIIAGSDAEAAQKSITCSAARDGKGAGKGSSYGCVLAGGQKPIQTGSVAIVKCSFRPGLHEATVRVQNILGVSADLKRIDLEDVEGTLRPK
jgi:hypothetical protein